MVDQSKLDQALDPAVVREEFKRRRGHWNDDWEAMLAYSPAYVAAYLDFSAYVADRGTLSAKFRELIYVATNCTPTHMFAKGFRNHARQALALGATRDELMAVVATVSAMGFSSYVMTAQVVAEALPSTLSAPADAQVWADHAALFGDVRDEFAAGIRLDPDFHGRWLAFATAPLRGAAGLSAKEMHLIALAVHAQCTQLNAAGVGQHAHAALAHGASHDEVLDVARLVSSMGIHAMVFALPLINELGGEQL
ncbi:MULTISPECIES: carboxymuconolactone decarboxylase family protein [unclassified Novosphingobium]|uniref:carboxymuconolactone decarboxylase family protein n=1 Tax=unclassified Novosphingobium TaxID=2644732 RepID=UPI0017AB2FC3|nr:MULTISPECIES: carboxymuconolactone decarboxylase family protein [unclassified Novosphingobium]NMN05937.1 alkylhydroperoxidase/carboxymuconolactone decarboxylase family protein YurZ [Novosphingobium sp. SG919]NMN88233.1 alkylhydroperoxidase/carboxymuconolactone decarboxylase family protein YurZ [Novosphingobium sp. SG916]